MCRDMSTMLSHPAHPLTMLVIKPGARRCTQEELRPIGVGASIGHGQHAWCIMLQLEVLIAESCTIDALTPGAIASCEITTLQGSDMQMRRLSKLT